jgi:hypothetical protein
MSESQRRAADRAATQHGLITRAQGFDAGMTRSEMRTCANNGRWTLFAPGVFHVRGAPITWHTRLLAACLSTGGLASHRSTAALLQVDRFPNGMPEVSVARARSRPRDGIIVHESRDLHLATPVTVAGIPTTDAARLAVDLGAVVPFERYAAAMHDLLGRKLLTWPAMLDALVMHSKQGRNGAGPLRALLDAQFGQTIGESELERSFFRRFEHLTIPPPLAQYTITDELGVIMCVDFAYPPKKIAIELDGRRYHLTEKAFEEDRRKRNRLKLAGWLVLEFTWRMLIDKPHVVFRQIEQAYRSR